VKKVIFLPVLATFAHFGHFCKSPLTSPPNQYFSIFQKSAKSEKRFRVPKMVVALTKIACQSFRFCKKVKKVKKCTFVILKN